MPLYLRYIAASIKSQMQYRASFIMMALGHFVVTAVEMLGIVVLFDRFETLEGWTLPEVALFYGVVNISFALAESTARGFDTFPAMVRSGEFDRILLRPRGTAFQVAAREWRLREIGRLLQGLLIMSWAASTLGVAWTPAKVGLLAMTVLGGLCLFYGLFVLQATMSFWTVDTLEVMNTVTYGGNETAQYPISIYHQWFRKFFTYVVPMACVTYFPLLVILGRPDPTMGSPLWFRWLAPLVGGIFLIAALRIWQIGVRHYHSTGS